ncbi:hypothetical protein BV25DRAFT_1861952, partial [Artomyces pyxidatus]
MASLLERMNVDSAPSVGPVRSKQRRVASGPYEARPAARPPKGDVNGTWKHDMFSSTAGKNGSSLIDRLQGTSSAPPKMNFGFAERALRDATGLAPEKELSIRGASTRGNVVEVKGLVNGTTAEDVQAIFKRFGTITTANAKTVAGDVVVRLTFKSEKDARAAVDSYDGVVADGRKLTVRVVGGVNASLSGRLNVGAIDGSVDALLSNSSSKMRSDDILEKDPEARARAIVLVAPPGADPRDYTQ